MRISDWSSDVCSSDLITTVLARRHEISWLYRHRLKEVKGIKIPEEPSQSSVSHAYFPILVEPDYPLGRDGLYQRLKDNNIFARRYFYQMISEFPMYRGMPSARREVLPIDSDLSAMVLCLPIYPGLDMIEVLRVVEIIKMGFDDAFR